MGKIGLQQMRMNEARDHRKSLYATREKLLAQTVRDAIDSYDKAGLYIEADYEQRMSRVDD